MGKTVNDRGSSAGAIARRVGVSILATVILFGSPTIVRQGTAAAARAEPEHAVSSAAEVSRDIQAMFKKAEATEKAAAKGKK